MVWSSYELWPGFLLLMPCLVLLQMESVMHAGQLALPMQWMLYIQASHFIPPGSTQKETTRKPLVAGHCRKSCEFWQVYGPDHPTYAPVLQAFP